MEDSCQVIHHQSMLEGQGSWSLMSAKDDHHGGNSSRLSTEWGQAFNQHYFFLGSLYLFLGYLLGYDVEGWSSPFSQASLQMPSQIFLEEYLLVYSDPIMPTIKINHHTFQGSWIALNPETSPLCFVCFYCTSTYCLMNPQPVTPVDFIYL